MSTTVKICGVNSPEALAAALHAGADMVGLVFYEPSPRFVGLDTARQFARHCRDRAEVVALTVDAPDATLEAILQRVGPDYFQLHGSESPERVAEIQEKYGVSVIKAIGVSEAADLALADAYAEADGLLIDAKPPRGAVLPGGNGVAFDWALVRDFAPKKTLGAVGRPDAGERRPGDPREPGAFGRRVLGSRERAGGQEPAAHRRLHRRGAGGVRGR